MRAIIIIGLPVTKTSVQYIPISFAMRNSRVARLMGPLPSSAARRVSSAAALGFAVLVLSGCYVQPSGYYGGTAPGYPLPVYPSHDHHQDYAPGHGYGYGRTGDHDH